MKPLFYMVKYTPVLAGVLMTIHCYLLLCGYDSEILKEFVSFGLIPGALFTILSYKMHFCILHRMNIWFDCVMDICIKAQRYDLFCELGFDVCYMRLFMFVFGACIQALLFYKIYGCKRCRYTGSERPGQGD